LYLYSFFLFFFFFASLNFRHNRAASPAGTIAGTASNATAIRSQGPYADRTLWRITGRITGRTGARDDTRDIPVHRSPAWTIPVPIGSEVSTHRGPEATTNRDRATF
jgi:hypothetical protein